MLTVSHRFIILLLCIALNSIESLVIAQNADSSIFSKPLKINESVKTERAPRSEQKGDTLIFNATAYKVSDNADSERLISKMPGINVTDGGVDANGKRFLKNKSLEVSIGVNDLLNNNILSYWHTISNSGISDGANIGIGRYFSLQCIWHFRTGTKPKKIVK